MSRFKIKRLRELEQDKVMEKDLQQQDKEVRAAARVLRMVFKEVEAQRNRNAQATACLDRQRADTTKASCRRFARPRRAQRECKKFSNETLRPQKRRGKQLAVK